MTTIDLPPTAAPTAPRRPTPAAVSGPAASASETAEGVSGPASTVSQAPWEISEPPAESFNGLNALMIALSAAAAIGGLLVGGIGFAMSYDTLAHVAHTSWGFSEGLAKWFPVGVDASIVAFLAMDLYLVRKGIPWPLLRMAAHAMTAATIWFNASSQGSITADPARAASHGVMPFLFVIGVEAGRRLIIWKARLEAGTVSDRVPLHRWLLAPLKTPRFYRRMRLYGVTSYPEMVRREQELTAYELWLKRKYKGDLSEATEDEMLPMTMAPRGFTVAEALAMPDDQEREAEARAEEAERRRLAAETRRAIAEAEAETERLRAEGRVETVRAQVAGETGQARAHAQAQVSAAERIAEAEKVALETAVIADARARAAASEHQEALEREAAAEADRRTAALEKEAAEDRKAAAEADQLAAAEADAIDSQTAAIARKAAAEADKATAETKAATAETLRRTAETERRTTEELARKEAALAAIEQSKKDAAEAEKAAAVARRDAAEIERRAVEAEDFAKLKPRERAVRRVARMILAAQAAEPGQAAAETAVALAEIQAALDVSSAATASEYRAEAIELLRTGYRP